MKKTLLIVVGVMALVAGILVADRRASGSSAVDPPPTAAMVDLKGKAIDLAPYQGKVVLINFWATYCKPCLTEIPWMNEFQAKYKERGFVLLGVNMDDEGTEFVQKWLAEPQAGIDGKPVQIKLDYAQFLGNNDVADAYGGLIGLPTTLLINREGKVVKRYIGISSKDKFEKAIEELLQ